MTQERNATRGFTLLELLLVVGIAAVLIIAGITTYSVVSRSVAINETIREVNMIVAEARRLNAGQGSYGAIGTSLEAYLANSRSLPAKFVSGSEIVTPFNKAGGSVVLLASTDGQFSLDMALPPSYVPEIAAQFDPNKNSNVAFLRICGAATGISKDDPMPSIPDMIATCGGSMNSTALSFSVLTR